MIPHIHNIESYKRKKETTLYDCDTYDKCNIKKERHVPPYVSIPSDPSIPSLYEVMATYLRFTFESIFNEEEVHRLFETIISNMEHFHIERNMLSTLPIRHIKVRSKDIITISI